MEKDRLATWSDAFREWAWNAGAMFPDRAWLLHDCDVWLANPHYVGPPVRHPEDDGDYDYDAPDGTPDYVPDMPDSPGADDIPF
jgi:hypothetical protein